ncbi:MAG: Holliday junction helicase RuvA [Mucilaginibacter sp.]|nr:Holliday junction helicase RuvA [Mucilaginibacter sp.]
MQVGWTGLMQIHLKFKLNLGHFSLKKENIYEGIVLCCKSQAPFQKINEIFESLKSTVYLCTYALPNLISHISYLTSMRVMAFDYGTKRIGIAVTDPMQIIATGLDTIHPLHIIDYLKKYFQTEQVERFIVGEPKQMDNTPSQSAIHVKGFVNLLTKTFPEIPIEMLDERFTSKMASATIAQSGMNKKHRQNKELVDTISAVILLQSWMRTADFR